MHELIYNGKVTEQGELKIANRAEMLEEIKQQFSGKDIEFVVRRKRKVRSLAMNRYYWAEVIPKVQRGMKELGERLTLMQTDEWLRDYFKTTTKEQAHEFLKDRFIDKEQVDESTGEVKEIKITTTRMNTVEFQDYVAAIIQFAAETLNVQILMPNEQSEINY